MSELSHLLETLSQHGISEAMFNDIAAAEFKRADTDGSGFVENKELIAALVVSNFQLSCFNCFCLFDIPSGCKPFILWA